MDFTSRYNNLNDAQRRAVDTIDGPVMVIAGPGTGKTELLSMRAASILKKTDVLAENILCLTFTESGASAMRERLTHIVGPDAYKISIQTFHSFGADIISQYGEYFYHGAHFRAADDLSSYELLHSIFDELDHANPLVTKMNGEYTHLNDVLFSISELKRSGLTSDELLLVLDANDQVIDTVEPLLASIFSERIAKTTAEHLELIIPAIRESGGAIPLPAVTPLSEVLADSLGAAVSESQDTNSTKPLTAWRNEWMKKDQTGSFILKSRDRQAKLRAVSYVYYRYLTRMQESELYDFDDMILRVVHAMEVFPELRFNLQEKYQYIMVDEFQDTNMAQMRILYSLTNNEVLNGKPNIMVVGDDDQAIYSFQGADVGNIHYFEELFPSAPLIVLTDNYRSAAPILTQSRQVIVQGNDRLEQRHADITKALSARNNPANSDVAFVQLPTQSDERTWLVDAIATDIKNGVPANTIAVLARRHHEIVALLPYFSQAGINVSYERRDNVLDNELIILIEHISSIIVALFEQRHDVANSLLPELMAHPAFSVSALSLWKLSLSAQASRQSWMETLALTPEFVALHGWLIEQAKAVPHTSLETMLDCIMGVNQPEDATFISPLYTYFFAPEKLADKPHEYILFLEALRTIRSKLRDYQPDTAPTLVTFNEFIRLCHQRGATITSIRPAHAAETTTINLMTAHKSKGLEFDTVYVIGAVDSAWGERVRSRSRLVGYPENLKLSPVGDTTDERMRLFYVSMTRAKRRLIISASHQDDSGKSLLPASFISQAAWTDATATEDQSGSIQTTTAQLHWYQSVVAPIQPSMHDVLRPMLEQYKLSVTHLNNFLDVSRGGPQMFLMQNLLRFPQAIHPSAGYGVAIHAALQRAHAHLAATKSQRPAEDILRDFEDSLRQQNLSQKDFDYYLQKGSDTLTIFLKQKYAHFTPQQKVEVSFAHQAVHIGEAHLTGSLDMIDIRDTAIAVTDYKTGKPSYSWTGKTDFEKIKLHKYKQQLMFYELLLRNSRDYSKYTIDNRILQFVEPTPSGEIVQLDASFTEEECQRFSRLIEAVWRHITTLNLPDVSSFEPSYKGMLAFESWLLDEKE